MDSISFLNLLLIIVVTIIIIFCISSCFKYVTVCLEKISNKKNEEENIVKEEKGKDHDDEKEVDYPCCDPGENSNTLTLNQMIEIFWNADRSGLIKGIPEDSRTITLSATLTQQIISSLGIYNVLYNHAIHGDNYQYYLDD